VVKHEKQFLEIELAIPVGFQAVRFDFAKRDDWYLDEDDIARKWEFPFASAYKVVILRKV
jgi:hypothetical protein